MGEVAAPIKPLGCDRRLRPLAGKPSSATIAQMTPHWSQLDAPPPDRAGPVFMDAVLTPNRSLSRVAFSRLLAGVALLNALVSLMFILRGAYPVAAFLALDVALLWWAFRVNYHAGRAEERVRVGAEAVLVTRRTPEGRQTHWTVSPLWANVSSEERAVEIWSAGKSISVGAFLSPGEREAFSVALRQALARAKGSGPG